MYVMTKAEAQEWLNRPENQRATNFLARGEAICAVWRPSLDEIWQNLPFAVDHIGEIKRKTPWHWPKPDADTPIDAKVWVRLSADDDWVRRLFAGDSFAWEDGRSKWTACNRKSSWDYIVLANPDDLDEVPQMDLVV